MSDPLLIVTLIITMALVCERFLYACVCLVLYLMGICNDGKSTWFVTLFIQNMSSLAAGTLSAFSRLLSVSIRTLLWCMVVMGVWWVLYYASRHSAPALIMFQRVYNAEVGGILRLAIVVPMQMLQLIWDAVIPLWNVVVYCVHSIPTRILLENVLDIEGLAEVKAFIVHLAYFVQKFLMSLVDYVQVIINPPDLFDADFRLIDLMTPFAELRLAVSYGLTWVGRMCSVASSVVDIALYPFLDINFGLALHNLGNGLLYLIIHVPAVTVDRCKAGGGELVYCLPDFEPVFDLVVEGIRNVGNLVDNWLDIVMVIVQSVLTGTSPACDVGMAVIDIGAKSFMMGLNETTVVGIGTSAFALTDGWNIQVFERSESHNFPDAFPVAVRVNYGIAKVSASVDIPGLLGCMCSNQDYGMQIVCAVAPLDLLETSYFVPVEFSIPTTSFYMSCERAKIKVETIRRPVTRFTSNSQSTVRSPVAEAAIWVRPMCSSEMIDMGCIETFKLSGCFPYCMALWTKGYKGSLVLRPASDWWNTVAMVSRDCGLHTWDLRDGELKELTSTLRQKSGITSPWSKMEVQVNNTRCVYSGNTFSRMIKSAETTASAYSKHRSITLETQPFAFAGDLVFTAVHTSTSNTGVEFWGIEVHRIWGNQVLFLLKIICSVTICLIPFNSSSERGPHFSKRSKHCLRLSSGCCLRLCSRSVVCCSICRSACLSATDSVVVVIGGSSCCFSSRGGAVVVVVGGVDGDASKKSARIPATDFLVSRSTVRFGRTSRSWIALEKLMSFLVEVVVVAALLLLLL